MIFIVLSVIAFFQTTFSLSTLSKNAELVLNSISVDASAHFIMSDYEWKELKMDDVVTVLARRTTTSFGRWGLAQLLHPINDKEELLRRQKIIMFLAENEDAMSVFQEQLELVRNVEKSLLAYWDKHDQLNAEAQQFYYTVFGLKELNKSSLALNASAIMEMFTSLKYLATMLALKGVTEEWRNWRYGTQKDFSLWRGIQAGFKSPVMMHYPYRYILPDSALGKYTIKDSVKVSDEGSWGDRFALAFYGCDIDKESVGWLGMILPSGVIKMDPLNAFFYATMPVIYQDYVWGSSLVATGRRIVSMYRVLDQLQQRVADVAQSMKAIKKLQKIVAKRVPELSLSASEDDDIYLLRRNNILKNLLVPRFLNKSDYFYSRGHVLTMHSELMQEKKALIPLFQSISLLDAYCSIARLYKESQDKDVTFCFPEFLESEKPFLNYRAAWLPLLSSKRAVTNDVCLGDDCAGKMVLTGPNGSGKSTILKTIGISVILAQSGFPVPAQEAQQTLFSELKTNLAPREDLQRELSKGMAGMKAMDDVRHAIGVSCGNPMLVLIDEPYDGMVDAEAARRIYLFGKDIADYSNVLLALATHTQKPMQLAHDTAGIFDNYQVKINEIRLGQFERLFKLEKGPALWWFEDEEMRSRFVDWLAGVVVNVKL